MEYHLPSEPLLGNGTTTDTIYTVIDLTPGTTYELRVLPFDSDGNQGQPTNVVTTTEATGLSKT